MFGYANSYGWIDSLWCLFISWYVKTIINKYSNYFFQKGPIVSGLANRYGCRPIIIIGSIGASICMALSTLSPNVWVMMIIYGIFGGIFFGMVYLPYVK